LIDYIFLVIPPIPWVDPFKHPLIVLMVYETIFNACLRLDLAKRKSR